MKNILEVENLKGKKVLLRLDLNVPIENGAIKSDFRIRKILPTIDFLQKQGAKIIILSHIGREKTNTLEPVFNYLKNKINLTFVEDILCDETKEIVEKMNNGDIILFENLRKYDGEDKNDDSFTKTLAAFGDVYINEAFAFSHREASSVVGLPQYLPSYSGILFKKEFEMLSQSFNSPHPSIFILGGNKFNTKLPLIEKFLNRADFVFVGGALVNNLLISKGLEVGMSLVAEGKFDLSGLLSNKKLVLPVDLVVNKNGSVVVKPVNEIASDEIILDIGHETIFKLKKIIEGAKFILFNGPLGDYTKGFDRATSSLVEIIANSGAESVVGGGDTVACISELGLEDKIDFVSTGGGAMLEFLLNEDLPGIKALNNSKIKA